jgi:hypothetical protein
MLDRLIEFWGFESRRELHETITHHAAIALRLYILAIGVFAVAAAIGANCK